MAASRRVAQKYDIISPYYCFQAGGTCGTAQCAMRCARRKAKKKKKKKEEEGRNIMEFNELMQEFAGKFGITDMEISDGTATLEIDGIAFGFISNPVEETLTLVADLGRQAIDADGVFGAMMLRANFLFHATKGATLFQNPENEAFGLEQMFRLVDLDVDTLSVQVEKFANLAEDWKEIIAGAKKAEDAAKTAKAAEPASPPFSDGDFMRV